MDTSTTEAVYAKGMLAKAKRRLRELDSRLSAARRSRKIQISAPIPSSFRNLTTDLSHNQTETEATEAKTSQVDLLRQIEEQLMLETPIEFALAGSSRPVRKSSSEPISITALRRSEAPVSSLPAIADADQEVRPLEFKDAAEARESKVQTADMIKLLDEVRDFRGQVTEIRDALNTLSRGSMAKDGAFEPVSVSKTSAPDRSSTVDGLRTSLFMVGTPMTDRSSFQKTRSAQWAFGAQPSTVYIQPAQGSARLQTTNRPHQSDTQTDLGIRFTDAERPSTVARAVAGQESAAHKASVSTASSSDARPAPSEQPELVVPKQRSASNVSTFSRRVSKPRGPRQPSVSSVADEPAEASRVHGTVSDSTSVAMKIDGSSSSYETARSTASPAPDIPRKSSGRERKKQAAVPDYVENATRPTLPRRRPCRSNSADCVGRRPRGSRAAKERVVSTPYTPRGQLPDPPAWYFEQETQNLGSEFDDIINLGEEHKRMLEKFIDTLGKLSLDVSFDERKRDEGRRRMDNAIRALEGWI